MKMDFWTSTEYSGFMVGLIRELRERDIEARQRYHISEATYRAARSTPARLFLRFRQYVAYPIQLCAMLLWQRIAGVKVRVKSGAASPNDPSSAISHPPLRAQHDVAVVSTNTFYAPLLATYLHPNVIHLVYDLFPEAMIHSGKWKEGGLKVRLVRWITGKTLERAKCNVFLGQRLKDYVESIHGAVPNAAIIEVGADQSLFTASPKERLRSEGGEVGTYEGNSNRPSHLSTFPLFHSHPTILYCGNLGNMHDTATLFDYWKRLASGSTQLPTFHFHCSGPKRAALETVVSTLPKAFSQNIELGGGLSQSEWITAMESAEVALVTMAPGSETVVMPSKTYSAMMAGQAILAIAPEDSDLVDLIKADDCGWWVEPGDVDGLAAVVAAIQSDAEGLLKKRERAYHYAQSHLGQDRLAEKWMRVIVDD
jgi:glycosyltransferase involved in cell wall biosynthesis